MLTQIVLEWNIDLYEIKKGKDLVYYNLEEIITFSAFPLNIIFSAQKDILAASKSEKYDFKGRSPGTWPMWHVYNVRAPAANFSW